MKQLTPEDENRIGYSSEQYAFQVPYDGTNNFSDPVKFDAFKAGAEYATKYERQQSQELADRVKELEADHAKLMDEFTQELIASNKALREHIAEQEEALNDFRLALQLDAEAFHKAGLYISEKQVYDVLNDYVKNTRKTEQL